MNERAFERFKKKAGQNRMFIRASKLKKLSSAQKKDVGDAIKRSKLAHMKIYEVQSELERMKEPFVIFKTFSNHPDMGLDVDIIVLGDMKKIRDAIIRKFNGKILEQTIASDIAGKVSIAIEGSPVTVELHDKNFSQIGEHTLSGKHIIKNSRIVRMYGMEFRVPSHEDEVLLTVIHRVYRHISVRFSDVYNLKRIFDNEKLDWNYILKNSKDAGILPGLLFMLDLTEKYGGNIENMEKFPYYMNKGEFINTYFGKIWSDLVNFRVVSFFRMTLVYIPLLALESLFAKRIKKGFW